MNDTARRPRHDGRRGRLNRLKGCPEDESAPQPKAAGWHPVDWACEFAGTAFQLVSGFSVVALLESPRSPATSALPAWSRLVLIGIAFGGLAAAVALSPPGRRSGAHLNPAVTVGFWLRGHTPSRDMLGYVAAQTAGALLAAAVFLAAWGSWADSVDTVRTVPQQHLNLAGAAGIEAALTFGLLMTVFVMVSSPRTARWTPAAVTGVLALLIWAGAPHTGASMNPARTIGPDAVASAFTAIWCYLAGPLAGAAAAAGALTAVTGRRTLTAKLFHDPEYPSVHATALPAKPHPQSRPQEGAGPHPAPARNLKGEGMRRP